MDVPPVSPLDASLEEEEDKSVPSTSGEDRAVSLEVVGVADQGAEGSDSGWSNCSWLNSSKGNYNCNKLAGRLQAGSENSCQ